MCRKRAIGGNKQKANRGQAATEYALGLITILALGSMLFLFYQGFVQAGLYGNAGESNGVYGLAKEYKAYGLERTAALPFP